MNGEIVLLCRRSSFKTFGYVMSVQDGAGAPHPDDMKDGLEVRAWKGHDREVLDRLHTAGYISDPALRRFSRRRGGFRLGVGRREGNRHP
jgi:hypothetical protein